MLGGAHFVEGGYGARRQGGDERVEHAGFEQELHESARAAGPVWWRSRLREEALGDVRKPRRRPDRRQAAGASTKRGRCHDAQAAS